MKIAYNPEATALTAAPSNNDITFDLAGKAIYARGVKFEGTNTTYSVFKKHTSDNSGGYDGLVPVPSYTTTTTRYLREDGNWEVPIMSEAVTALGTNGNYVTWTKNGTVNNLTVPYAITAHTIEGFTRRATVNCTWGTLTASNEYTPVYWGNTASGGGIGFSDKDGKTYLQIDGDYYANEGSSLVLHTANYNSYAPTLTGTGASGTWEIDINGTATSSTSANYSRNLLGRKTSGGDYDAVAGNLIFAEWNTHNDNRWYLKAEGYETRVGYANDSDKLDGIDSTEFLKKVSVSNNSENDFNTFENMTLTGRGDPTTGASLKNAPWTGAGPAGGYGVLTYLWSGYGTLMVWGYNSNRIYIRPKYYANSTATWSSTWDSLALTSDLKNPTDYYWADVQVSSSSSTSTKPTFALTTITNNAKIASICFEVNDEINRYGGHLYLQHRGNIKGSQGSARTGNILMVNNGGNVGIGNPNPNEKLHITGNTRIEGTNPALYIRNTSTSADTYSIIRFGNSDGDSKASIFLNGPDRTSDGGKNVMTIRNNVGSLRLDNDTSVTGLLSVNSGATHRGIKVGDNYINAINKELIIQNNTAIRFGDDAWDYDVWAGLRYVSSAKTIHLGIADKSIFSANNALGGGTLNLPGIHHITSALYNVMVGSVAQHTPSTSGWYTIAQVTDYFNYDIYITGGWNNGMPSTVRVNICNINGTSKITQLAGYVGSLCSQIRLGKVSTDKWDVQVYITAQPGTMAEQRCIFTGYGGLTVHHTSTLASTAYSATNTLAFGQISGISLTTDNYTLYLDGKYLPLSGGLMDSDAYISWNNGAGGNDVSDWKITGNGLRIISSTTTTSNAPTQYATALHVRGRYGFQLASEGGVGSNSFYIRNISNNNWNALIHSGNIGSQSVNYANSAGSLGGYNISNFMVYADYSDYVAASFTDKNLSKKATEKYIEYWDSAGWFNSAWGQVTANYGFVGNLTGTATNASLLSNTTLSNSNGSIPKIINFPAYSYFGSSTDTYDYLQNIVKWIYDNANYGGKTYLMGVGNPNSLGMMNIQLYGTSGKNGDGWPRYCSGTFLNLGDSAFEIFGTNNYNYYRYRLSVDGHSHRITKLHRRDAGDDYSLQHHWTGSYWYLRGYYGDSYHAGVLVEYANNAGSATKDSAGNTISSYYLPLSGGTMTGTIITPGNDTVVIKPKYNNYDQIGGEGQAFWKIWATNFYGSLHGNAASATYATSAGISDYLKIHDIRDNNYAPNSTSWPLFNIRAWFNNTGTPNGDWWSGITVKGWTNDYNVWLLASTATNHSYANFGLFFRTGNGSSWTNWKNVVTSESVNNIVVTSSLPATKVNNTIYILV